MKCSLKYSLLIILVCYTCHPLFAQQKQIPFQKGLFVELGGPGFVISLNYQRPFKADKKEDVLSWRAGLGLIAPIPGRDGGSMLVTLPAGIQYKPREGRFEWGTGLTMFYLTNGNFEGPGFYVSAAYYLNKNIRVMISPFIGNSSTIKYYFGFSSPVLPFAGIDILF